MRSALFLALMFSLLSCRHQPSPEAQRLFQEGFEHVLAQRYAEALPLLTRASELGSGEADCQLGILHQLGRGVPADPAEAFHCFERGAKRGEGGCQYRVGRCYQEGIGVPIDKQTALSWHRKAAAQDNRLAPYSIDDLEREGYK